MSIHHLMGEFHLPSAQPSYAPSLPIEPIHGELRLKPDIQARHLQASVTWTLLSKVHTAKALYLQAEDIEIMLVRDNDGHEISWSYDGHQLSIFWRQNIPKGDTRSLTISYQVQSPVAGLYFGGPTPDLPDRGYWLATDHETTRARYWLPCIDHSNVRTTFDIHIQHEKEHIAVSAGYQAGQKYIDDNTLETHWKLEQRSPVYLLCVIVGEYIRVDYEPLREGIPLAGFAPKGNSIDDLRRAFAPTKELIEFAETKLGPLPWAKYFQFFSPGIGGAMENISLVSWDSRLLLDDSMHADIGELFDQINLHELAHTWFGDLIVCRDYAHVWLKESWATYFECVWMEHKKSTERFHTELLHKRSRYFSEVSARYSRPIMTRVFDSPWRMYDMHLYPGGAVRLHMLRKKLGDDVFWEATQDYIETYTEKVVETDDFRHKMELHSGQSLAHFFDQWFGRAGYPKLEISQQYFHDSRILRLQIKQTIIGGNKDDLPFEFSLSIAVESAEGSWSQHTVQIDSFHHSLRISAEEMPKQVIVDPECTAVIAIDFKANHNLNKRALAESPWIHGRIIAAKNLCKKGNTLSLAVISELYSSQYWSTRETIAKELRTAKHPKAAAMLCEWLSTENNSQVQVAIVNALASHRGQKTADSLLACLHRSDISHRVKGSVLIALSKLGEYCPEDEIFHYCEDGGWKHYVREFAYQALGQLSSERALNQCRHAIHSSATNSRSRMFACSSLASIAKKRESKDQAVAEKELIQALADENGSVRRSAITALGVLGRASSIPHIEACRTRLPSQEWPIIDRAVRSCRSHSDKPKIAALEKRISALEEKQVELLQQINDMQAQLHLNTNPSN